MSAGNGRAALRVRPILPPYPADCIERTIRRLADRAEECGVLAVKHENLATMHEAARLALLAQIHRLTEHAGAMIDAAKPIVAQRPSRSRDRERVLRDVPTRTPVRPAGTTATLLALWLRPSCYAGAVS